MDRFSFFFAFYGLILGLAVTEPLGGFASLVRARMLKQIETQTALLASLIFIVICATWIDAWNTLTKITLGRRANVALLIALILLFMGPYWVHGTMEGLISRHYGY